MSKLDLFAGIYVSDLDAATTWYARLLGSDEAFRPNDVEAVWELAEHRFLYVELKPEHAGHSHVTVFLEDFEPAVDAISARGIEPAQRETYENGVRKWTYRDPDGNEIGFGGGPTEDPDGTP
ncbi:VOC family protein [Mumia zhuanghuii]|uniref:VOC family protein n=2 Tax=Mumia TaxID=1546255 RepID=A0ABW1QNQ9_9ACTN|nr:MULTISPECIES: VOC family protein [Mumia]KAA1424983.1 VOC family protein [Mumia zhuanghuii]